MIYNEPINMLQARLDASLFGDSAWSKESIVFRETIRQRLLRLLKRK